MKIGVFTSSFCSNTTTKTAVAKVFNDVYKSGFNIMFETFNLTETKIEKILNHESQVISDDPISDLILYQDDKFNDGNYDTEDTYSNNQMMIGPNDSTTENFKYGYAVCKGNLLPLVKIKFDSYTTGTNLNNKAAALKCIIASSHFNWIKYIYIDPVANDGSICTQARYLTLLKNIRQTCIIANTKVVVNLFYEDADTSITYSKDTIIAQSDAIIFPYNNSISNAFGFNTIATFVNGIAKITKNKELFVTFTNKIKTEKDTFAVMKAALQFAENLITPIIDCYQIEDLLFKKIAYITGNLNGYDTPDTPNKIYDDPDIESVTFADKSTLITVMWIRTGVDKEILLYPNPNQYIILKNGDQVKVVAKYTFNGKSDEFILIKQTINISSLDYEELDNLIFNKRYAEDQHIHSLLDSLPTNYNINTELTNLYKLLRSLNFELTDVDANMAITNDNAYLLSAHNDSIYKNFGVLADLNQESDWDSKKYKAFVSGVIKSLLEGPTVQSIEDAVNLFINYEYEFNNGKKIANVTVTEAYKEQSSQDTNYQKAMAMFTFYVEIESLNEDEPLDSKLISKDVNYIVKILKPAHTLAIIQIAYSREENYREWYFQNRFDEYGNNKDFETMDEFLLEYSIEPDEDNYNLNPCSFITLGDFTVSEAESITEYDHKEMFAGLDATDKILYGSCTLDISTLVYNIEGDVSTQTLTKYTGNTLDNFTPEKGIGEAGKQTIQVEGSPKDIYYNHYPLGIITKIREIEFEIS